MAESVVSFVVEKLVNLLGEEAAFLRDVHDQVERIKDELVYMKAFLEDADAKEDQDKVMKIWVADIRKIAYDVEDIIDTFIIKVASHRKRGFVKRSACIFNKWIFLHQVGKQIAAILARIQDIKDRKSTYIIQKTSGTRGGEEGTSYSSERLRQLRRSSSYIAVDEFIVGQTKEVEELVAVLMKEEESCCIVSIVGIGGLGKTTLASKVYNHNDIKGRFKSRAWVSVSKEYKAKNILQRIIKIVSSPSKDELKIIDKMEQNDLERKVREFLEEKRYLVVLDDVWGKDAWDSLKNALPNTKNKSRMILTTRNKDVARHPDLQSHVHELRCLSEEDSWKLFCRKTSIESDSCPANLEKLGRLIVGKCGGLPLAIIVLGGLLSKIKSFKEWRGVLDNINWNLEKDKEGSVIFEILGLSYSDLPYYLKSCFLYLGLFPEDSEINVTTLIHYWIVEGIIPQQGRETTEIVAEKCLSELIDRSLIQVVKWTKGGRAKSCRLHDLLRDLCVSKAKEQNLLLEIIDGNFDYDTSSKLSRRCVIHSKSGFDRYCATASVSFPQHLRTFMFDFEEWEMKLSMKEMEFICKRSKLVRVMDIDIFITRLPRTIGNLIHLRYLRLDLGKLEGRMPSSIKNLQNLLYLHIYNESNTKKKIPNVIWKMERLKHLFINHDLISSHLRIDTLKNLQSLRYVEANGWIRGGSGAWDNLTNLTDLGICNISSSHAEVVFHSFRRLNRLHLLSLRMMDGDDDATLPNLAPLALCTPILKLHIRGGIGDLSNSRELPQNLTKLTFHDSNLKQNSMVTLANLSNLRILLLWWSYKEKQLVFVTKGFPQLQVLKLSWLSNLEELMVEDGALEMLKHLEINRCDALRMVPEGLRFMTNLKELHISGMRTEFKDRFHGEDKYKVEHIPSITITEL